MTFGGAEIFGKYDHFRREEEPSVCVARVSNFKSKVHTQVKREKPGAGEDAGVPEA